MKFAVAEHDIESGAEGHQPVMLEEVLEFLAPCAGGRYLDATFGGGGHSGAILLTPETEVVAMDWDPEAAPRADRLKRDFRDRFLFLDANFSDLGQAVDGPLNGILFDLGVSSFHLDTPERGFSHRFAGRTDMRMDPRRGHPAVRFLEEASRSELVNAIRDLGEEPAWRPIVKSIIQARGSGLLGDTLSLSRLIDDAARGPRRSRHRSHPASRAFQGIRIAINREIQNLERALPVAFAKLVRGGVLVAISFHSLEDRVVKRFLRRMAGQPEHRRDNRAQQDRRKEGIILTKRPLRPRRSEIERNIRSRSARLRAIRKGAEVAQ